MVFDNYIVGTFLVSLFGFAFLFILRCNNNRKKKTEKDSREFKIQTDAVNCADIGGCSPEYGSCDDVIIVGAGVAGAALAHTLGKVNFCFLLIIFLRYYSLWCSFFVD